jgi:hypothetical protein
MLSLNMSFLLLKISANIIRILNLLDRLMGNLRMRIQVYPGNRKPLDRGDTQGLKMG